MIGAPIPKIDKTIGGLVFKGQCSSDMAASDSTLFSLPLAGFGDDYFNDQFYIQIIYSSNSTTQEEIRQVNNYISATGEFSVASSFSSPVNALDEILILHEGVIIIGRNDSNNIFDSSNVVANRDGSLLERSEAVFHHLAVLNLIWPTSSLATMEFSTGATDTFGAWAEITDSTGASFTTELISDGHIIGGVIESNSDNDEIYIIELGYGAGPTTIGAFRFLGGAVPKQSANLNTKIIPSGEIVKYRMKASKENITCKGHLRYHLE